MKIFAMAFAAILLLLTPSAFAQDPSLCIRIKQGTSPTQYRGNCPETTGQPFLLYLPAHLRPAGDPALIEVKLGQTLSFFLTVKTINGEQRPSRCTARARLVDLDDFTIPPLRLFMDCGSHELIAGKPTFEKGRWTVAWDGDRTDPAEIVATRFNR